MHFFTPKDKLYRPIYHLMPSRLLTNKTLHTFLFALLIAYQTIRLIVFANVHGGLEHDSGWFLGIARSLAETGTYATLVSTMQDPSVQAGYDVKNEFFQIQDEQGKVVFMVGATVGPAQIVPDAIIIKLFGSGFWQFRTASLLYYALFLGVASWLLYSLGGLAAALLFQVYIFFYPHLSIFLGYESLAEVPVVLYVLLAYTLFAKANTVEHHRERRFFFSGVAAALALLSKAIALIPLSSLGILWVALFVRKKITFKDGFITAAGALTVLLVWEVIRFVGIVRGYGFDIFWQQVSGRIEFFRLGTQSSGQGDQPGNDFFWYKFFLASEISHPGAILSALTLLIVFAAGPFLIWHFRRAQKFQNLVILLWGGWLVHTAWFLAAAQSGWVRRYWTALILAVLLLSLLWGVLLRQAKTKSGWLNWTLFVALTLVISLNFFSQRQAATLFISDALVEKWYQQHLAAQRTRVPWSLVPRQAQQAMADFIATLPESARLFYPENHKSAEVATLTGHILYPVQRRPLMQPAPNDVVVIGPSLISPWTKLNERPMTQAERDGLVGGVIERIKSECPHIIFENSYYILCALE